MRAYMKKIAVIFLIAVITGSCSKYKDNTITITNESASHIVFNFRSALYTVNSNSNLTIKEIPNGTFSYETTYSRPAIATSSSVNGDGAGDLAFNWDDTHVQIYYSSLLLDDAYTLNVSITSNVSSAEVTTDVIPDP
jgi:hypothetical protein